MRSNLIGNIDHIEFNLFNVIITGVTDNGEESVSLFLSFSDGDKSIEFSIGRIFKVWVEGQEIVSILSQFSILDKLLIYLLLNVTEQNAAIQIADLYSVHVSEWCQIIGEEIECVGRQDSFGVLFRANDVNLSSNGFEDIFKVIILFIILILSETNEWSSSDKFGFVQLEFFFGESFWNEIYFINFLQIIIVDCSVGDGR